MRARNSEVSAASGGQRSPIINQARVRGVELDSIRGSEFGAIDFLSRSIP